MPLDQFDARAFKDKLILGTVVGAEHLLLSDLRPHAKDIEVLRGFVRLDYRGNYRLLAKSRLYSTCAVELCRLSPDGPPDLFAIEEAVNRSLRYGLISRLDGPIRFRISPLRFGRWTIRDFLCDRFGWQNDPSNWTVNVEATTGFLVAQFGPLFHSRRFPKLLRIPASTNPVVAAVMIRSLDRGWNRLLDPVCGAGTLLIEAIALKPSAACLGLDSSKRALREAQQNLLLTQSDAVLVRSDARNLPLADKSVEAVVANLPFGKRAGTHTVNLVLYPKLLGEVSRVLVPGGVAVLLSEEKRLVRETAGKRIHLRLMNELKLEVGGLHPSIFKLERLE